MKIVEWLENQLWALATSSTRVDNNSWSDTEDG